MSIFDTLSQYGIVPVVAIEDVDSALPLADALIAGGLPVAEITFRTDAASQAIAAMTEHRKEMIVGAGTVLNQAQVDASIDAGARFGLAPGFDPAVLEHAARSGLPFAPGVMTPSELQGTLNAGCTMVKFFPAVAAGGPAMLASIAAPFAHTGIRFNPTGGVNLDNLADWFAVKQVQAVGGTWIATRADIAAGNWESIAAKAAEALACVRKLRGSR